MKQLRQVVMLPTEKASKLIHSSNGILHYCQSDNILEPNSKASNQHLYIISDEEIKEGDWYIDNSAGLNSIYQRPNSTGIGRNIRSSYKEKSMRKIIATTNENFRYYKDSFMSVRSQLPKIPESFIKAYVESNGTIKEVLVEYNEPLNQKLKDENIKWIKLHSDNTIIISFKEPIDMIALINERMKWSFQTFPEATALSSLIKLQGEVEELQADILIGKRSPLEYADILHCVFDIAGREVDPVSPEEIFQAFKDKFEINKNRTWIKNADNTYSHKKS